MATVGGLSGDSVQRELKGAVHSNESVRVCVPVCMKLSKAVLCKRPRKGDESKTEECP